MKDEKILEKEFQELIFDNKDIQNNILEILKCRTGKYNFEREVEFINGITTDFIIYDSHDCIVALLECKRADIGVTEYVRGVGQLFQYEYFQDKNISPKKYGHLKYNKNINNNILIIPSDFIKNTKLNIGKFRYPINSTIFEVNICNNLVRKITQDELLKLASINEKLISICQYYVRDNRIFEYYIAFQMIVLLNKLGIVKKRVEFEKNILRKFEVINNKNWRNAFITLSNLGFIENNLKVYSGAIEISNLDNYGFTNKLYKDYLHPYIDLIMDILEKLANEKGFVKISNQELVDIIRANYNGKDILYLTQSDGRYISSWLNILRDDFGCIDFKSRECLRKINYIPRRLDENERIKLIKQYAYSIKYVEQFEQLKTKVIKEIL
ncbi:TPA: hypothetical protein SCP30_000102 [Campylobacter jejuni]|nr:hypothetical protein [Campylobacter jejuni]HEC2872939.1 hypothetical protein [Campylobacter jejuni]HEG1497049.1 hypothetical protein [Campylobacter jejuni]